jgi:ankyrin repeat protein
MKRWVKTLAAPTLGALLLVGCIVRGRGSARPESEGAHSRTTSRRSESQGNPSNVWDWQDWGKAESFISVESEPDLPELHRAAGKGDLSAVARLLEEGADANAGDRDGWTPLHWAAHEGHDDVVKLLLSKGASPHAAAKELGGLAGLFWPGRAPAGSPAEWRSAHKRINATPLKAALAKGRRSAAQVLLDVGVGGKGKDELLEWAVKWGYAGGAEILVDNGASVDLKDKDGWTLLHWAARGHHADVVKVLLDHGADARARTGSKEFRGQALYRSPEGQTALHLGATDPQVVALLLDHGADVNARDASGATPLHDVGTSKEAAEILLEHGARVNVRDRKSRTPLAEAAQYIDQGVMKLLLAHSADINARQEGGRTVLHDVVASHPLRDVEYLLDHGADVNARDDQGQTPLHVVADAGTVDRAKLLVKWGAKPTLRDRQGRTALEVARQGGNREVGVYLESLESGGRAEVRATPLHEAATRGDVTALAGLLAAAKDVNVRDGSGQTPLHRAVAGGHLEAVKLLLEANADVEAEDKFGWTPLHKAAADGQAEIAKLLLAKGAPVDAKAEDNTTPLHLAVQGRHHDVARLLLSKGADANARRSDGMLPMDLTVYELEDGGETDDVEMIGLLEKHGGHGSR